MKIYDINGKELLDVRVTSSARHEEEMGKSDFVRLSWRGNVKRRLGVGTYIVPFADGLKFRLMEPYEPQQDAEDTFTYQPEFQHPLMWLSKVPFTYATKNTLGEDVVQQEWEYTGLTSTLLQYAVGFINDAFGLAGSGKFSLGMQGSVDTSVSVSFSSADVLSALTAIANACAVNKCEWHLSWPYKKLYFGQVSVNYAETVPTLEVGANVGKASVSAGGDGYYNVFFPQGSTRNMSAKAASGENVSTGIRLGLNKTKYPDGMIDTRTDTNEPKQTLSLTFDDVYPHVDCYAYNVRPRTRYLLDDDGNKVVSTYNPDGSVREYKKYTVWYMRLAYPVTSEISGKTPVATTTETLDGKEQTLYWYDYVVEDSQILDGYTLCGSFSVNTNDGALASSLVAQPSNSDGFELIFHKTAQTISANSTTGDSGVSILAGDFEIVFVNQNETIIPTNESEGLVPRGEATPSVKGNIVILYNIAMGDDEVAAAQDELESETLKEIAYRQSDLNNYTFNAYPQVWAKSNPKLYVGQRVVYDDGNGYSYTTRVMKLVTNLDYDIVQEITVGNSTVRGAMSQLKEDVKTIMSGNWAGTGGGLSASEVLAVVRNYATPRFLSKQGADTAQGEITFAKGLRAGGDGHGVGPDGAATLLSVTGDDGTARHNSYWGVTPRGLATFMGGLAVGGDASVSGETAARGIRNAGDISNTGTVTTRDLNVTGSARFHELLIDKIRSTGGSRISSPADGFGAEIVEAVDASGDVVDASSPSLAGYKLYWLASKDGKTTRNMWERGDQAVCMNFNTASEGETQDGISNKYYWALVTQVSAEPVSRADDDGETRQYHWIFLCWGVRSANSTGTPEAGDEVAMLGHRFLAASGSLADTTAGAAGDTSRQSAIYESSYTSIDGGYTRDDGTAVAPLEAPLWAQYRGVDDFDLGRHRATWFDATGGVIVGDFVNTDGDNLTELINETQKGAKVYVHTAYAKGTTGADGTWLKASAYEALPATERKEYRHIGFCSNYTEADGELGYGDYTWSYTGADGDNGHSPYIEGGYWHYWSDKDNAYVKGDKAQGDKGDSVTKTGEKVEYCLSASGTEPPAAGWQASVPEYDTTGATPFLWTRTTVTFSGGDPVVSYSVARQGKDGATPSVSINGEGYWVINGDETTDKAVGDDGHDPYIGGDGCWWTWDGSAGEYATTGVKARGDKGDGVTVKSTETAYQTSSSGTTVPEGDWAVPAKGDAMPEATDEKPWLWTRVTVTYSDGTATTAYSVARKGKDGAAGLAALRNLLVGSGLKNASTTRGSMPELVVNSDSEGENTVELDSSTQYLGTDSLHIKTGNTGKYPGMYFCPVAIKRDMAYTASVWAKGMGSVTIEVVNKTAATPRGVDRDGWLYGATAGTVAPGDGWKLIKAQFTTDGSHDWVEVSFHGNPKGEEFWLSRPMLEEGDYKGWTLNEADLKGDKGDKGDSVAGAAAVQYRLLPVEGNEFTTQAITTGIDKATGSLTATTKVLLSLSYTLLRQEGEAYEPKHSTEGFTLSAEYDNGDSGNVTVAETDGTWTVADEKTEYSTGTGPNAVTVTLKDSGGNVCDRIVVPLTLRASHLFAVTNNGLVAAFSKSEADSSAVQGNLDTVTASLQSKITANANAIASKVEKTDFDTLSGKVAKNTTDISQASDRITAQATAIGDNTTRIGKLEVGSEGISLKVDRIATPARNLLAAGSVGEIVGTGKNTIGPTYKAAAERGKTYTITWKGYSDDEAAYMKFYVSAGAYAASSGANKVYGTSAGFARWKFTPSDGGTLKVYVQYVNSSNSFPSSFDHKIHTDWIRIDEGDWTSEDALGLLEAWEPARAELEAVNLLPDHLLDTDPNTSVDEANVGTRERVADDSSLTVATGTDTDEVRYIRLTRSGYTGSAYGGVRWMVPFRGAGDYTLSASIKDMRPTDFTPDTDNAIYAHLRPCDADGVALSNYAQVYMKAGGTADYGWVHAESPSDRLRFDDEMESASDGTRHKVEWLQVHLFMRGNGDMAVSRLCLSKCSHATLWNAQELSGEREDEARQLATGIDIYNKKIVATGDTFEWRDNSGNAIAEFDADNGATFRGNVSAETFSTNNGGMSVGADGALHATGAEITGKVLAAGEDGRAVELNNGSLVVYGTGRTYRTEHTGQTYGSLGELLPGSGQTFASTLDQSSAATDIIRLGNAEKTVPLKTLETTAAGTLRVTMASVTVGVAMAGGAGSPRVTAALLLGGTTLWSGTLDCDGGEPTEKTFASVGGSAWVAAGSHELRLRVLLETRTGDASAPLTNGWASCSLSSVTLSTTAYNSLFFGNGLMLSQGNGNYFAAMIDGDGNTLFEAVSGGRHGLRLGVAGFFRTAGGTNWHKQPVTLFAAKVSVSSDGASIVANNSGAALAVSRVGAGRIRIAFPAEWSGYKLGSNGVAQVTPIRGGSGSYWLARVYAITDSYLDVMCSDDDTGNDGGTMFVELKAY